MSGILDGKTVLITGIITDASIAFHAAAMAQEQGATVIITGIPPERLRLIDRIAKRLPKEVPPAIGLDVTNEEDLEALAGKIREIARSVDGVMHSIAFAPRTLMVRTPSRSSRDPVPTPRRPSRSRPGATRRWPAPCCPS